MSATTVLAASDVSFPLIPALVLLPAVGALVVAMIPRARASIHQQVAVLFAAAAGAISVWAMVAFDKADDGYQFTSEQKWVEDVGIQWLAGIDGISLFLVVLTGLLFPLAMIAVNPGHDSKGYYAWLLLLQAGCFGVFVALDLFMFLSLIHISEPTRPTT